MSNGGTFKGDKPQLYTRKRAAELAGPVTTTTYGVTGQPVTNQQLAASAARLEDAASVETVRQVVASHTKIGRNKSYADLLNSMYDQFYALDAELATSSEPMGKKAETLMRMAKILPLIHQAEKNATVRVKNKSTEELTDSELQDAVSRLIAKEVK
jgi:predicted metallo-beta-lactamase superfamily hydrolase